MLFPKYIWLIIGWYSENWYREGNENDIGCNRTELEIAVYGHITTEVQFFGSDEEKKLDNGIVSSSVHSTLSLANPADI